jgi:hypothetical protein
VRGACLQREVLRDQVPVSDRVMFLDRERSRIVVDGAKDPLKGART